MCMDTHQNRRLGLVVNHIPFKRIKPPMHGLSPCPPWPRPHVAFPPCAALLPPTPRFLNSPALPCPPCRDLLTAIRAPALRAAIDDPRSASLHSGDGRPAGGHGPAADAAGRGLGRGGLSSPRPHACGVLGELRVDLTRPAAAGLARLCLRPDLCRSGLGLPRGPVSRHSSRSGQSGPREDRRGSPRFAWFAALCRALWSGIRRTGFGWGRARKCGTRQNRREPNPASEPRSGCHPRSRAPFKSAENGGFPTPLVRPRLSRPFFVLIPALWGLYRAPAPAFHPKNGLKRRCKAAGNSSRAFSLCKNLGTTCFRRPACQARTP